MSGVRSGRGPVLVHSAGDGVMGRPALRGTLLRAGRLTTTGSKWTCTLSRGQMSRTIFCSQRPIIVIMSTPKVGVGQNWGSPAIFFGAKSFAGDRLHAVTAPRTMMSSENAEVGMAELLLSIFEWVEVRGPLAALASCVTLRAGGTGRVSRPVIIARPLDRGRGRVQPSREVSHGTGPGMPSAARKRKRAVIK